jgi:hypothetical protein
MSVFHTKRRATRHVVVAGAAVVLLLISVVQAWGLGSSTFEITDGNLKVDGTGLALDWANVADTKTNDLTSGQNDNSFGQGTKEDTTVPTVVAGQIPPNKSDLKTFGIYQETASDGAQFLDLFWTRVQDPSGTTNMDFEFNQKQAAAGEGNGITPLRTNGDLLITYDLAKGGTHPVLSLREWVGNATSGAWGAAVNLTDSGKADGSINTAAIPAADSDGLITTGVLSARTFGEAQIDLDAVFEEGSCLSIGSAYLKSRSSDSFPSALKDFIAPQNVDISNCGRVVVAKTDGTDPLDGASFTINPANSAPTPSSDLVEVTTGLFCIDDLLLGTEYTITESVVPAGYTGADPQTFTPSELGGCGDVDADTTPDLTFVNTQQLGNINVHKQDDEGTALEFAVFTLYVDADPFDGTEPGVEDSTSVTTCQTDSAGDCSFSNITPGQYWVVETTTPADHSTADPQNVILDPDATLNLVFENPRTHTIIVIVCHDATDTLAASDVTLQGATDADDQTATSLDGTGLTAEEQAALCGLGGASFGGLEHGNQDLTVDVGSGAHLP